MPIEVILKTDDATGGIGLASLVKPGTLPHSEQSDEAGDQMNTQPAAAPGPRRRIGPWDIGLVLAWSVFTVVQLLHTQSELTRPAPAFWAIAFTLLMVTPVAFARAYPLPVAALYAAGGIAGWLLVGVEHRCGLTLPAGFWLAFAIGLRLRGSRALLALALLASGICAMGASDAEMDIGAALVMMVPVSIGLWFAGRVISGRGEAIRAIRAQNLAIEATREATAVVAVQADRDHISDGLEDLLHHRLSGLAARATAGSARAGEPDHAHAAFAAIADEGRETLTHLRDVVGSLRADPQSEPQPDLSGLAGLVTGSGGRVTVEGQARPLPPGLELSGYRIVEQLLNSTGVVDVTLHYEPDALEVRASGPVRKAVGSSDLALAMAEERAALHGGSVQASRVDGRLHWVAHLPVTAGHAWG